MVDLGIDFYDIAFKDNQIWYAVEDPSEPIQVFNNAGTRVFSISSSIVPRAHGMTFDDLGYLWVSDADADLIYQVDLNSTGISGQGSSPLEHAAVTPSCNPFSSSVSIRLTGFGGPVSIMVMDISGRIVTELEAEDQLVWNGTDRSGAQVPSGAYLIVATDDSGNCCSSRLIRL
ncbi:MAG: hypothetical protein JXA64_05800 [Candidatus Fermentibacteraceae bacterium]|nr:hypothetical protein [Candidatus Fermentibacteraceae bacterium]MBN2608609.1 hypothetical protein [Candidatus Fermentibacteraceae bacterium]